MNRGYLGWAASMIIARLPAKVQSFLQIFSRTAGLLPTKKASTFLKFSEIILIVKIHHIIPW